WWRRASRGRRRRRRRGRPAGACPPSRSPAGGRPPPAARRRAARPLPSSPRSWAGPRGPGTVDGRRRPQGASIRGPRRGGSGVIRVTETVVIADDELAWSYARSGGPGGQNVNKVASKAGRRGPAEE